MDLSKQLEDALMFRDMKKFRRISKYMNALDYRDTVVNLLGRTDDVVLLDFLYSHNYYISELNRYAIILHNAINIARYIR